ncbi:SagB/ThcOx family dehydrogenase [Pseudomonas gingeri]|uniref:SagB/ThcOx family dehydrogenase n=1 Tax=Pseudomonas gingeri TaxID=117681 RepID=UPI0015A08DCD|nr:SagB/ThcOx family dehydrogenase [Pseudomonas gingeri]NWA03851.1 SagB/ThcOx family dehydrogenase [Pseudomonas gingeri]NWA12745.1 SagB/ThcOx family dehydrogenase [Pseudomonas gingeri]NWA58838.1 SagB/ThcOx family dehydrogenase [Pseudomonas gingeri]NWA94396.1 SagB/ThcOx family dehydrogenase [Pseudomonas gingeri]NWB01052.1 SagB/ThcOx family dehydrogenase [Pseudomonas gingeri]
MKTIPHDYYLKFIDQKVFEEVQNFHNKGNYTIHEAFEQTSYLHQLTEEQLNILSANELSLYPDLDLTHHLPDNIKKTNTFNRNESCDFFENSELEFSTVQRLVAPLLTKNSNPKKRNYPSGGALYPIETFICSLDEKNEDWPYPQKILHLLPASKSFEILPTNCSAQHLRKTILSNFKNIGSPSIALIYVAYLPKTTFKYRYRGYRLALMEAGSIYMLIELQAADLGLNCRLWTGYTDHMLSKAIGLNPALFSPICCHLIGSRK